MSCSLALSRSDSEEAAGVEPAAAAAPAAVTAAAAAAARMAAEAAAGALLGVSEARLISAAAVTQAPAEEAIVCDVSNGALDRGVEALEDGIALAHLVRRRRRGSGAACPPRCAAQRRRGARRVARLHKSCCW